jgi:hypothetical protein
MSSKETEKGYEVVKDETNHHILETEEGFEVVEENKIDFVQNAIKKEEAMEPNCPRDDNKQLQKSIIDITTSELEPIASNMAEKEKSPTPEPLQSQSQETNPGDMRSLNPEHIQDNATTTTMKESINESPGLEVEVVGSGEDNIGDGDVESDE